MTARSKKRRNKNNGIRRVKNKVKEATKLKKMLGLIDEDGMDLMEKIQNITEQQKNKEELEKLKNEVKEDIFKTETENVVDHNKYVEVVNPKTNVKHIYNEKTKQDQFGSYPVWYNAKKERRKQRMEEGKITKKQQFRGKRMHFIDRNSAWKKVT